MSIPLALCFMGYGLLVSCFFASFLARFPFSLFLRWLSLSVFLTKGFLLTVDAVHFSLFSRIILDIVQ